MTKEKRNLWLCRLASLLFLIMLVSYWKLFQFLSHRNSNVFTIIILVLFYLLNLTSLAGLFFAKSWGFISTYFSIPISTALFAVSYFPFLMVRLPMPTGSYIVIGLNTLFLIGIVLLQIERHRFNLEKAVGRG